MLSISMDEPPLQPSSPGVTPVELKDCVEEVLKFTLISSIQGKIQTGLSNKYCADLLRDDPSNPLHTNAEVSRGVPSYPLYKRLASSLYQSIDSGALCSSYKELIPAHEGLSLRKKDEELNKLIMEKGSALLRVLKEVNFELHVQEPFSLCSVMVKKQLKEGVLLVTTRGINKSYPKLWSSALYSQGELLVLSEDCLNINFSDTWYLASYLEPRIQGGHVFLINKCLALRVQDVRKYSSFREMLEVEGLASVLPGVTSIEEGVQIYRNFYSEEKESLNGVLAIYVHIPTSPLCVTMASILSGLSYDGVQKLLGFVETAGTNGELLPPPKSALLSTFSAPHNPDVKGFILTNGARALAKHINRSSEGYWGSLHGNDEEKNRHAADLVNCLLDKCTWMNMHIVQPHGNVFEIRNDDGYGARWSVDGTKFIGFLEPYAVDGHSKGWKH